MHVDLLVVDLAECVDHQNVDFSDFVILVESKLGITIIIIHSKADMEYMAHLQAIHDQGVQRIFKISVRNCQLIQVLDVNEVLFRHRRHVVELHVAFRGQLQL